MRPFREITTGLRFPEGPIAMPDGSIILVEIERGSLTRVLPDGTKRVVARTGAGPNGAAIGPDGRCYVCNNGGFKWSEQDGLLRPVLQADDYSGGRIERVDLATGAVEVLYRDVDGRSLKGPNDIVFDRHGGLWFTDLGKVRERDQDRGGVYYAKADGSMIREVVHPMVHPNGIGLSPDEGTLYVAESVTGRLWAFEIIGPGEIRRAPWPSPNGGRLVAGLPDYQLFDSLAVEAGGNVCVATLAKGAVTVFTPDGAIVEQVMFPDHYVTNICFGGPELRTAFVTLSHAGRLVAVDWERTGLPLNFLNR
jgi:gluconolactonase